MLSEMIYKENRGTAIKYIVKNIIIKESATNVFQVCMSIVYDSFTLELNIYISIRLHCYCGDNVKYGLLSKHLFQRKLQYRG